MIGSREGRRGRDERLLLLMYLVLYVWFIYGGEI
jgi:hypothetical protein